MKGFPAKPTGPLGPWLRRVNEAVASVPRGASRAEVEALLGPPDELLPPGQSSSAQLQALMNQVAGGPTLIRYGPTAATEPILVYCDPYRSRRRYLVVLEEGRVTAVEHHTVAAQSDPADPS